jgi:hypothetical protein
LFAIDRLKSGIFVERETSVFPSAAGAIAAAKLRAHDVARRHPGQEPDTFSVMDSAGRILGVFLKSASDQGVLKVSSLLPPPRQGYRCLSGERP